MSNVGKDFVDDCRVGDICNNAQVSTAQGAYGDVELERAFEPLCPESESGIKVDSSSTPPGRLLLPEADLRGTLFPSGEGSLPLPV